MTSTIRSGALGAALATAVVGASWGLLRHPGAQAAERRMADRLRARRQPVVDAVVARATDLGSVYGIAGASAALAASGRPRLARDVAGAGATAWIAAQGAKPAARRPRPYEAGEAQRLVATPAGSSWPSGHAAVAAAMGWTFATQGRAGRRLGAALTAFVGGSRVYVGVHYPTDVTAGIGVGILSAMAWRRVTRRWRT